MVFTAAQTTAFFTKATQMVLSAETWVTISEEGLEDLADLVEFDVNSLKQITDNLRRSGGRINDPGPNTAPSSRIPTPVLVFGAKSQLCLKTDIEIAKYYKTTGSELSVANMRWSPKIKTCTEHWKSLWTRKNAPNPDVPKISKTLHIMKWTEAFDDFSCRIIGTRTIPLSYVIRETVTVPDISPLLARLVGGATNVHRFQPFSDDFGLVEEELIAPATHEHPLYQDDNTSLYLYLEEATLSTMYASSIQPYSRLKDGRGAWITLTNQYAGEDKWGAELKNQDGLLHTFKWKGESNFSLDKFIAQHRNMFVLM